MLGFHPGLTPQQRSPTYDRERSEGSVFGGLRTSRFAQDNEADATCAAV